MSGNTITRRGFLANTSAGAVGLGLTAAVVRGAPGANERINVGMIGCGDRASGHLLEVKAAAERQNARVIAVCDVWQVNLQAMAARAKTQFGDEPTKYTRFGDLLANKDIDAVTIATPDFSHGPILVAALKAGKDVFVEKPMTIQLEYANEALDIARKDDRVVQVGTQYRSHGPVMGVAKYVQSGAIGKVTRYTCAVSFAGPRWQRPFDNCKAADVDWDAYLLDLPKREFDPKLLRQWHLHKETSNGLPGLWMVHYVDAMALIMDAKYPTAAVASGGTYLLKEGREHADIMTALLEYPEGFLFDWSMDLGSNYNRRVIACGLNGAVMTPGEMNGKWTTTMPPLGADGKPTTRPEAGKSWPIPAEPSNPHMENFLECVRTRSRPRADIQFGHQHTVASIMAAQALETGRRQKYDAVARTIEAV